MVKSVKITSEQCSLAAVVFILFPQGFKINIRILLPGLFCEAKVSVDIHGFYLFVFPGLGVLCIREHPGKGLFQALFTRAFIMPEVDRYILSQSGRLKESAKIELGVIPGEGKGPLMR